MSILDQTYKNIEVIIVDDGSTDNTLDVLSKINDNRLKIYSNEENRGISFSLNRAKNLAQGKYIARMDADDTSHPERLEKQFLHMESTKCDAVGSWMTVHSDTFHVWKSFKTCGELNYLRFYTSPLFHATLMFRKEIYDRYDYNSDFDSCEDYELWMRMFDDDIHFENIQEALYTYNTSTNHSEKRNSKEALCLRVKLFQGCKYLLTRRVTEPFLEALSLFWRGERVSFFCLLKICRYHRLIVTELGLGAVGELIFYRMLRFYVRKNFSGNYMLFVFFRGVSKL
jgi:glycosyltransferase involved in cell wall biosynthesis